MISTLIIGRVMRGWLISLVKLGACDLQDHTERPKSAVMVEQNDQNHGYTDLPGAQATPAEQAKPIYCPIFLIFSVLKVFRKVDDFCIITRYVIYIQHIRQSIMAQFSRFSHAWGVWWCVVCAVVGEVRACRAWWCSVS